MRLSRIRDIFVEMSDWGVLMSSNERKAYFMIRMATQGVLLTNLLRVESPDRDLTQNELQDLSMIYTERRLLKLLPNYDRQYHMLCPLIAEIRMELDEAHRDDRERAAQARLDAAQNVNDEPPPSGRSRCRMM